MKRILYLLFGVCILIGCESRSGSSNSVGSYSPSFTGNDDTGSGTYVIRTVPTVYIDGTPAGRYEVIQRGSYQYVRRVGGTQEYGFSEDYQYGFNYVFWNGAAWLYFN